MYNSRFQIFGSKAYLFGESHIDSRESIVSYEICQRLDPDIICVESPTNELYPSKSTGHSGLKRYVSENNTPIRGIDTEPSQKTKGKPSENIGEIYDTQKDEVEDDSIYEHRKRRMNDPITNIEKREEHMVQNILDAIHEYNPQTVFILVGKMHAEPITNTLILIGN